MGNQIINDCEGTLLDSENGQPPQNTGHYDHGENYTFTICVPNGDSILITFTEFCTEYLFDTLRLFDGPDINSPQIGITFSGNAIDNPGNVPIGTHVATSGCLTIHFGSDASRSCEGWEATWYTITEEPPEPQFNPIPNPPCESTSLMVSLDLPVLCDSIYAQAFSLSGPDAPNIINAVPVNCLNGSTTEIELTLDPPISKSGVYSLNFASFFRDECNNLWDLSAGTSFIVNDCPLSAEIFSDVDTICLGECVELEAEVLGGDSLSYVFNWSNGISGAEGPHNVCPVTTTTYSLTVDDASAAPGDTAYKTIVVNSLPDITYPTLTDTICRNATVWFTATPTGGLWSAPGMAGNDSTTGRFRAGRAGGIGDFDVFYTDPITGCTNSSQIHIIQFSAGGTEGACPGTAPFMVAGGAPSGGYWTGPFIDSTGIFDPSTPGSHDVTYHAPNGCSGNKRIFVDSLIVQGPDTVCSSLTPYYELTFSPLGGRWSGPGIIHNYWGRFDPMRAGPGWHTLTLTLEGCSETVNLFVDTINAGTDFVLCPSQAPLTLPSGSPAGGTWSGIGVVDSNTGFYDPGVLGGASYIDTLTYNVSGCSDKKIAYVVQTNIDVDTIRMCSYIFGIPLNENNTGVLPPPPWGSWYGPGVRQFGLNQLFDPDSSGPGTHTIYFDANGCVDSLVMVVTPTPVIDSVEGICINSSPFDLSATPPGGVWSHYQGNAITDPANGTFDPSIAGIGTHLILYFTLPDSCATFVNIIVDSLVDVNFPGIDDYYCFKDTNVLLQGAPSGGQFTSATGGVVDSFFNPSLAGQGIHSITYTYGSGDCAVSRSDNNILVGAPLEIIPNFTDSSTCYGENITLTVRGDGGTGGDYFFTWDNGLGDGQFQTLSPTANSTYTATVNDGCSDPESVAITIDVFDEIRVTAATNGLLCYGEEGFANLTITPNASYSYLWNTNPPRTTKDITAPVSSVYTVMVTNTTNNCFTIEDIELPGYESLKANFLPNPANGCINLQDPFIEFIDLSTGATRGRWTFGDNRSENYDFGINPVHEYTDTGSYLVSLFVRNEGNCRDTFQTSVCVKQDPVIFAPNAFTPNGDGNNDIFFVKAFGIYDFEMVIYNRWGELIFQSNDIEYGWDGYVADEEAPSGGYPFIIYYTSNRGKEVYKGMVVVLR